MPTKDEFIKNMILCDSNKLKPYIYNTTTGNTTSNIKSDIKSDTNDITITKVNKLSFKFKLKNQKINDNTIYFKLIHFIFNEEDFTNFCEFMYLSIKSFLIHNTNITNVNIYSTHIINSIFYSNLISEFNLIKFNNILFDDFLNNCSSFNNILSYQKWHHIHKYDYLRLLILYEYGGIYSDLDVICLKSLENLNSSINNIIMGRCDKNKLGNSIIITTNINNIILYKWLNNIKEWNSSYPWNYYSMILPNTIKEINVLNNSYFYPYHWSNILRNFFYSNNTNINNINIKNIKNNPILKDSYCITLWCLISKLEINNIKLFND